MTSETKEIHINGHVFTVEKLNGDGLCSCARCEQRTGWNRVWTSMCWRYQGKIYCTDCLNEVLMDSLDNHHNL